MNATLMNEIAQSRLNDSGLQAAIAQARAGEVPSGICLMETGTPDGGSQYLIREGDEIVCYKDGTVTRRTPMSAQIAAQCCKTFLARNNA